MPYTCSNVANPIRRGFLNERCWQADITTELPRLIRLYPYKAITSALCPVTGEMDHIERSPRGDALSRNTGIVPADPAGGPRRPTRERGGSGMKLAALPATGRREAVQETHCVADRIADTHLKLRGAPRQSGLTMLRTVSGEDMQAAGQTGVVAGKQVAMLVTHDPRTSQIDV